MIAIANYVWVKPIYPKTETASGIITTTEVIKPTTGIVVAIGVYCDKLMLGDLEVGSEVGFDPLQIKVEKHPDTGEELFLFPDRNIPYMIEP